jgi:hypothetical protein
VALPFAEETQQLPMSDETTATVETPRELCGYPVDSSLSETGSTYLAIGPGGRGVVLKKMDDDCLLRGQLHPSVRERLARVRELAHGGVANLYGVGRDGGEEDGDAEKNGGEKSGAEKDGGEKSGGEKSGGEKSGGEKSGAGAGQAWLIWEYVEGRPFDEYAADPTLSLRDLAAAGRELALALDLLHMQGIVHGSIGGGNVIVSPAGAVRLTHVSPLLYTDPGPDAEAVIHLLESAVAARGESESPLGALLAQARAEKLGLRPLAARLAALIESRELETHGDDRARDDRPRRLAKYAAVVVALIGLALGILAWRAAATPALRAKVQEWMQRKG